MKNTPIETGINPIYKILLTTAAKVDRCELIGNTLFLDIMMFMDPKRCNPTYDDFHVFKFKFEMGKIICIDHYSMSAR